MAWYLEEIVKNKAKAKNLPWLNSRDRLVWNASEQLKNKAIKIEDAMKMLEGEFLNKGFDKFELRDIQKEISRKI